MVQWNEQATMPWLCCFCWYPPAAEAQRRLSSQGKMTVWFQNLGDRFNFPQVLRLVLKCPPVYSSLPRMHRDASTTCTQSNKHANDGSEAESTTGEDYSNTPPLHRLSLPNASWPVTDCTQRPELLLHGCLDK